MLEEQSVAAPGPRGRPITKGKLFRTRSLSVPGRHRKDWATWQQTCQEKLLQRLRTGEIHTFYLHAVIPYRRLALTRRPGTNLEGWVSSGARSTIIIKIPVKKPSWSSHTWKEAIRCWGSDQPRHEALQAGSGTTTSPPRLSTWTWWYCHSRFSESKALQELTSCFAQSHPELSPFIPAAKARLVLCTWFHFFNRI